MKQSRLDFEGLDYRKEKLGKSKYQSEINEYNEQKAETEENDPHGKSTGKSMGYAQRNLSAPKTEINYSTIDTRDENAGGAYDRNGTEGVEKAFQGKAGRNNLKTINIYNSDNAYGINSVDIDTSVRGQFVERTLYTK